MNTFLFNLEVGFVIYFFSNMAKYKQQCQTKIRLSILTLVSTIILRLFIINIIILQLFISINFEILTLLHYTTGSSLALNNSTCR